MTVEADLVALLGPLVAGRIYPDVAPNGAGMPYLVYQQIGGRPVAYTDNSVPDLKNGVFQLAAWGSTRTAVAALLLAVEAALIGATAFQARPQTAPRSLYEDDTGRYGALQDFDVWSAR